MKRSSTDKWVAGVLAGIAASLNIPPAILRIIFLGTFFGIGGLTLGISAGAMVLIYVICWVVM